MESMQRPVKYALDPQKAKNLGDIDRGSPFLSGTIFARDDYLDFAKWASGEKRGMVL